MRILLVVAAVLVAGNVQAQELEWEWFSSPQYDDDWDTATKTAVDSLGRTHGLETRDMGIPLVELFYVVDGQRTSITRILQLESLQLLLVDDLPRVKYGWRREWIPDEPTVYFAHYGYATAIPEPSTWVMLAIAAAGLWLRRATRRRSTV